MGCLKMTRSRAAATAAAAAAVAGLWRNVNDVTARHTHHTQTQDTTVPHNIYDARRAREEQGLLLVYSYYTQGDK